MTAQWEALLALAADYNPTSPVYISPVSLAIFGYSLTYLQSRFNWLSKGEYPNDLTDSEWDEIEAAVAKLTKEIWANMIGQVIVIATEEIPDNMLLCNGATYDRVDYPDLYAVIADSLKIDADTFFVPDLVARLPVGTTVPFVGTESGGDAISLTVGQLPSHGHTASGTAVSDVGHSHGEVTAIPTLITIGAGVPSPSALPSVGVTSPASANLVVTDPSISETGSGEEIAVPLPPVTGVVFAIIFQ